MLDQHDVPVKQEFLKFLKIFIELELRLECYACEVMPAPGQIDGPETQETWGNRWTSTRRARARRVDELAAAAVLPRRAQHPVPAGGQGRE